MSNLEYFDGDERPAWVPTVTVNGATEDMSSGFTFQVKIHTAGDPTDVKLTKTTNITGAAAGVITVAWASNELALGVTTPTTYMAQLKATRIADSAEWTIDQPILIRPRA